MKLVLVLVVWLFCSHVGCSPNGAPLEACDSMIPGHGFAPQNSASPFVTLPDQMSIFSNDSIRLTIETRTSDQFIGYLVMAFNAEELAAGPIGTFSSATDGRLIDCSSRGSSAATHANNRDKSSVQVTWTPPFNFDGFVIFRTTYIQRFDIYWVAQESERVQVVSANQVTDPPTGTTQAQSSVAPPTIYQGCGATKGCVAPDRCIASQSCSMLITYQMSQTILHLEIYGSASADSYVAVGFSKDSRMGDDSVTECVLSGNQIQVYMSFNGDRSNRRLPNAQEGVKLIESRYQDGYLYCRVERVIDFQVNGIDFNLKEPHHVLLARGPASPDNIEEHFSKAATPEPVDFSLFDVMAAGTSILRQLHGSFMVGAWLLSGSIGTLLPRYMKKTWVGKQLMAKDLWFFFHRTMMLKVWILTVTSFILIFIHVGGWVSTPVSQSAHPIIGCIVTALTFIQPFMAAIRPAPDAPKRYIFNWAHAAVGYSAHALAITCIFLAVEMEAADLPFCTYWVLAAHVSLYVLGQITFTLLARRTQRILASSDKAPNGSARDEPGSRLRKTLLAVYATILCGLSVTVIVFIYEGSQNVICST